MKKAGNIHLYLKKKQFLDNYKMNDNQALIDQYSKAKKGAAKSYSSSQSSTNKGYAPKLAYVEIKKPGIYRVRLFPNRDNPMDLPYEEVTRHFLPTPLSNGKIVPLPYFCNGKGCETCAVFNKKTAKGMDDAWKYKNDKRFAYYGLNEKEEIAYITMNYYQNEELSKKIVGHLKAKINVTDFNEGLWVEIEVKVTKDGKWLTLIRMEEKRPLTHHERTQFLALKDLRDMVTKISNEKMIELLYPERKNKQEENQQSDQTSKEPSVDKSGMPKVKSDEDMKKMREKVLQDAKNDSEIVDNVSYDMSIFDAVSSDNNKEEDSKSKPVLKTKINDSIWND